MNSKLYGNEYNIPRKILEQIKVVLIKYPNGDGVKRAKNLINSGKCTYSNLKRLKNYFDQFDDTKHFLLWIIMVEINVEFSI